MTTEGFKPNHVTPVNRTDNTAIKSSSGHVFWMKAQAGATGGAWALESNGVEILGGIAPANDTRFLGPFDPPAYFPEDITPDIDGSNITLRVAYN